MPLFRRWVAHELKYGKRFYFAKIKNIDRLSSTIPPPPHSYSVVYADGAWMVALFFDLKSLMAACTASSASIEQCSFTGGSFRWAAMSEFWCVLKADGEARAYLYIVQWKQISATLMERHSSTAFPFSHSVAKDDDAAKVNYLHYLYSYRFNCAPQLLLLLIKQLCT